MKASKRIIGTLAIPVITAVVLLALCAANGKSMIANRTSFNYFTLYAAIVMITTMALSINLNSGRFDFSLGAMAVLSSVLSSKITYALLSGGAGSAMLMLCLNVVIGALLGLASGTLYVTLRIPPIITSLGVTLIYEGITFTITGGKYVMTEVRNASMTAFAGNWYYPALLIAVVLIFIIYLFDHTRFGYDYKALQSGQKVAVNTGIREVPNAVWCYVICGALMGIVGFLNVARMGYLMAAVCMSMLNSTFAAFSNEISASAQSIINAVLLVVFLIYLNNEGLLKKIFSPKKA